MDNAATTVVSSKAIEAMIPCYQTLYGNPSSTHHAGRAAAAIVDAARQSVADALNANPQEIFFTSGGTESINWAIASLAHLALEQGKHHIISSAIEHPAVLGALRRLQNQGFSVTLLPVSTGGIVRPADLEAAIRPDTAFVTIMAVNNEIGTVQPIESIGSICRNRQIHFHCDAIQAVGHRAVDVQEWRVDMLSASAHKFHGPKGVGFLYCKKTLSMVKSQEGGAQERNKRGGTENVPGIAGMAAALKESAEHELESFRHIQAMREHIIQTLSQIDGVSFNGDIQNSLPGILNICIDGVDTQSLLVLLDQAGICVSYGAACASGALEPSHVLQAIGCPDPFQSGILRVSLSALNTMEETLSMLACLKGAIERLRQ